MEVTIITFATYYKFEAIHRYCPYTVGGYYKEHEQQEVGITGISLNKEILKSINTSNSNTISLFCLQKNYLEFSGLAALIFPCCQSPCMHSIHDFLHHSPQTALVQVTNHLYITKCHGQFLTFILLDPSVAVVI